MGGRLRKISFRCRATLCSSVHEPRIVSQSWQKAGCRRGCLVHGSVPMPILIPFGHPFGLPRLPLHHVLNCVVLGKLLFKSLGSSRVINQQTARSEVNFVTRFLGCSPRRKDCFCPFFLTLIPRFLGVHLINLFQNLKFVIQAFQFLRLNSCAIVIQERDS